MSKSLYWSNGNGLVASGSEYIVLLLKPPIDVIPVYDEICCYPEREGESVNYVKTNNVTRVLTVDEKKHILQEIDGRIGSVYINTEEIPFPDVWVPLNDNLRMLAGYGNDIEVGGKVYATEASFSRASGATYIDKSGTLRTAAVNEPRFEKEGLLIEGQSTNLCQKSNLWLDRVSAGTEATPDSDGWVPVPTPSDDSTTEGLQLRSYDTGDWSISHGGKEITLSAYVKGVGNVELETSIYSAFVIGGKALFNLDTGKLISTTSNLKGHIKGVGGGVYRISLTAVVSTNSQTSGSKGLYVNGSMGSVAFVRFGQIEVLPFATSYIPTNGAAATRAADYLGIKREGNQCIEYYNGPTPIVPEGSHMLFKPEGTHLRNIRGFMTPLTDAQKKSIR